MKSLFSKIFFCFWLMIILVIITTAFILYQSRLQSNELPLPLERSVIKAERAYEVRGLMGLKRWQRHTRDRFRPHKIYVIEYSRDIMNQTLPKSVQKISKRLTEKNASIQKPTGKFMYFGRYFKTSDNQEFRVIFERPPIYRAFLSHLANTGWTLLISLVFMSGIVCYWLARHLTIPVRALQKATQSLAQGDLDVEIAPKLGKRKDELSELAQDFDNMARQIKRAYNNQRRLVHDMSHELRAPIARMQVALAILESSENDPLPMTKRIQHELDHFESVIKQTLSLPSFENAEISLTDPVNIHETLKSLINDFQFEFQDQQLKVNLELKDLSEDAPITVLSKDNRLSTVFRNIISNAVQYRHTDTNVTIVLSKFKKKTERFYRVEITNQGSGVNSTQIEEIFEPFYRADQARTPGTTNIGLGLSIVKAIIELHKGAVFAENIYNKNESIEAFRITLELPEHQH